MYLPIDDLSSVTCYQILDNSVLVEYFNGDQELFYPDFYYLSEPTYGYTCSSQLSLADLTNSVYYAPFFSSVAITFGVMFLIFYLLLSVALKSLFRGW